MSQHVHYLGQRSFHLKVIVRTHIQTDRLTDTHNGLIVLHGTAT